MPYNIPDKAKLAKLPRWVREYIVDLEREREVAIQTLRDFEDSQTVSRVWYEANPSIGETRGPSVLRRYIQGSRITFALRGGYEIEVVQPRRDGDELMIMATTGSACRFVILPWTSNAVQIVPYNSKRVVK